MLQWCLHFLRQDSRQFTAQMCRRSKVSKAPPPTPTRSATGTTVCTGRATATSLSAFGNNPHTATTPAVCIIPQMPS